MSNYVEHWYTSHDGLKLYARDYNSGAKDSHPPLLCMHGLTRNSADFEDLAEHLASRFRIIAVDQRGRAKSAYDPNPENYSPLTYVQDMFTLLKTLQIEKVILIGTSMGGIMSMMMAALQPTQIVAMIINDIGPQIESAGLQRIQGYVGKVKPATTWAEAASNTKAINGVAFPNFSDEDWARFSRRVYRENAQGMIELDYDPQIATPIASSGGDNLAPDLWPVFKQIKDVPLLVIRGELSDILAVDCVDKMRQLKPDTQYQEVAQVGHAPILNEPEAVTAIDEFLKAHA